MSVIGTIAVHKCDGCGCIKVVHTDADIAWFEAHWYGGLMVDFCPECKDLIRHQSAIAENEAHEAHIRDIVVIPALAAPKTEAQYA